MVWGGQQDWNVRSGTSLAALSLEAPNALLSPLGPHGFEFLRWLAMCGQLGVESILVQSFESFVMKLWKESWKLELWLA